MAGTSDLDADTRRSLPNTLWRVTYAGSQSQRDSTGDILAADTTRALSNTTALKKAVEDHFDWCSQQRSCFLSVFSCEDHALNWAKQRREWLQSPGSTDNVRIHEIDTTKLQPSTRVFNAAFLATKLGIAHEPSPNELVFLRRIPGVSITRSRTIAEVEYGDGEVRPEISCISITAPNSFDGVTVRVCPALKAAPRQATQYSTGGRPWKRALSFANNDGRTKVIRVDNVYVLQKMPRKDGTPKKDGGADSYGVKFVTISIPGYVRNSVAAAVREIYPDCEIADERFEPNQDRWFKTISNVERILSVVSRSPNPGGKPVVRTFDVGKVLAEVQHAVEIRAYLEISVGAKPAALGGAGTNGNIDDAGAGPKTVKVTAVRGLVTNLETGEVDMPRFARRRPGRASLDALPVPDGYLTPDSVAERLAKMGIGA